MDEKEEVKTQSTTQKPKKLRMRGGKFAGIVLPLSTLAIALAIALPVLGDRFHVSIDTAMGKTILGQGQLHVVKAEGSEDWDTEYNTSKYSNTTDSRAAGASTTEKLCDDGFVLLKNSNKTLPLATTTTIAPFGAGYQSPVYGGSGSGNVNTSDDYIVTPKEALSNDFALNTAIDGLTSGATIEQLTAAEGTTAISDSFGGRNTIYYINSSVYSGHERACSGSTAVVMISRGGQEGQDLKSDAYSDGTKHQLALSDYERNTIKFAHNNCEKVVVIINSSNVMELGELEDGDLKDSVDAILWVGGPGSTGFQSMADILCGKINPSGRTSDIYPESLLNDPATKNFGDFTYNNVTGSDGTTKVGYFEYEKGIYVGYKYYETASAESYLNYDDTVVYPFGYGLSYTTFNQELTNATQKGNDITVTVKVTNTGTVAGKDVVEIYYAAPYTSYDKENSIEKSSKNLIDFGKTSTLAAGASEDVSVTFGKDEMASYSYKHDNGDGTKGCYILEAGDYTIYAGKDSHDSWGNDTVKIGTTEVYDNDNPRQSEKDSQSILNDDGTASDTPEKAKADSSAKFVAATNQFEESNSYMEQSDITNLSRSSFSTTQPTKPTSTSKDLGSTYVTNYNNMSSAGFNVETNADIGNVSTSKAYDNSDVTVEDSGYTLSNLRGKSYYDSEWDTLLNQIDYSDSTVQTELATMLYYGAYNTAVLNCVGKVSTKDYDGPAGFSSFMDISSSFLMNDYCSEVVIASTWNKDLAKEMGNSVGQEAITYGLSGWYAPGLDTHRTAFGGRNFEYYSEDGVLAGKISANVVSGSADQGCYAYIKHFAMNEQETRRNLSSMWANEQAIRETYLKPFEICVKEARSTLNYTSDSKGTKSSKVVRGCSAVMTSYTMIGTKMSASNYSLTNSVLRDEWSFEGMVITDFGPAVNYDAMIRSGNDFLLNASWTGEPAKITFLTDYTSNTAKHTLRQSVKNICYTVVNSNAYNGIAHGSTSYRDICGWRVLLYCLSGVFSVAAATGIGFSVYYLLDSKNHPERHKPKAVKNK